MKKEIGQLGWPAFMAGTLIAGPGCLMHANYPTLSWAPIIIGVALCLWSLYIAFIAEVD